MNVISVDINSEDALANICEDKICSFYLHNDLLLYISLSTIIKYYRAEDLFEAIDAHVKGGTDPQFNQAYNKWRYNK